MFIGDCASNVVVALMHVETSLEDEKRALKHE
jgi:hypothetical protein